ncbi:MAG: hypothetical protein OEM99_14995 [Gammaproteobacteria bacterium]|nr:hypothetical protein [Gammaproteobacteria bacterium]
MHAEIGPALADGIREVLELMLGIAARIRNDDQSAVPSNQFIDSEVVEMPAIGEVDPS